MRRERPGEDADPSGEEPGEGRPSKSAAKREAQAAQTLGEALIELPDAELASLELPEELLAALREARRIRSRGALVRQRQFIGKLMRDIDLTAVRARLAERAENASREAEAFKRIEAWRERLLTAGGPEAFEELMTLRPGVDRETLARQVEAARRERAAGSGSAAGRELFRALRGLFATIRQ